jgi:hypothetical protein
MWDLELKLLQENTWRYTHCHSFLDKTSIIQEIIVKIDKWDCIKLKSFCTSKKQLSESRDNLLNGRKVFASYLTGKELISKIYKELLKLNT